jgi:hypothetical protein
MHRRRVAAGRGIQRFEAKSAEPATEYRTFGDLNSKSLPKTLFMASSSDLP